MSAITGIFYRDGRSVDPELIKKMNNKLSHRGPDGSSTWCEGSVALGHQMLFTTAESLHEKLPFEDEESGLVITADARIDNRKELSELLELEDTEEVSDSLFILKAYEKWGEDCPDKLLGDFAFAIWDKNNEKLFCARDHMGVKPFYYYLSDDAFLFATEMKAILCNPEVPHKLNQLMVALGLTTTAGEMNLTFYEKILRLPSAYLFKIDFSNTVKRKYWELNRGLKIRMESDEEYVNKFREIFEQAVKCRLRSDHKIGFELSGGLDSSSLVSIAKESFKKNKNCIDTFSLITKDFPEGDESFYIEKMIDFGGINPHLLLVDQISPLNDIKKILWHLEQPNISPNVPLFWNLHKKMQNKGVRVLISGYDGDSVLSRGQNYLKELTIKFQLKLLIQEINCSSKVQNVNPLKIAMTKVFFPLIPLKLKKLWQWNKRGQGDFVLNNKELNRKWDLKKKYEDYDITSINLNTAKEFHYILITQASHQHAFEVMDKLSSAFFIEPRYPYFDKRLVEFCYALPSSQKFKFGWDRYILRRSMAGFMPEEIQWRPRKKFLTSVYEKNLLKFEKKTLEELIYKKNGNINIFADPKTIQTIYEKYKTKNDDYQRSDARDMWKLVTLMLWLQTT